MSDRLEIEMLQEAVTHREMELHKRMQEWRDDHARNLLAIPEDSSDGHVRYLSSTFSTNLESLVAKAKATARAQAFLERRKEEVEDG